ISAGTQGRALGRRHLAQMPGSDNAGGQTAALEQPDEAERSVELPPVMGVGGTGRVAVMIVVPALAAGDQGNEPIVPAVFLRVVRAIAVHMTERIDAPGNVPHAY